VISIERPSDVFTTMTVLEADVGAPREAMVFDVTFKRSGFLAVREYITKAAGRA